MRIPRRAESTDRATLTKRFVASGSFSAMLHSTDHQILYGRRGTGKTHALLHLSELVDRTGELAVYVDLRTIGTAGGMYADSNLSAAVRPDPSPRRHHRGDPRRTPYGGRRT